MDFGKFGGQGSDDVTLSFFHALRCSHDGFDNLFVSDTAACVRRDGVHYLVLRGFFFLIEKGFDGKDHPLGAKPAPVAFFIILSIRPWSWSWSWNSQKNGNPNQWEQQLPGLPHEPGVPQHPPDVGAGEPEGDSKKFEADMSL